MYIYNYALLLSSSLFYNRIIRIQILFSIPIPGGNVAMGLPP